MRHCQVCMHNVLNVFYILVYYKGRIFYRFYKFQLSFAKLNPPKKQKQKNPVFFWFAKLNLLIRSLKSLKMNKFTMFFFSMLILICLKYSCACISFSSIFQFFILSHFQKQILVRSATFHKSTDWQKILFEKISPFKVFSSSSFGKFFIVFCFRGRG